MLRKVNFKGAPLNLAGRVVMEGGRAPDFRTVNSGLQEIGLSHFKGKIKAITSFPSIDTSVCDAQVKEFNKRAIGLASEAVVIGISRDLPFAQKRFCDGFGIKNVTFLSDYRLSSFGINYGLLVKELGLLARAVIIIDKNDYIRYIQIVEELTAPPNYEDAIKNLSEVIKNPVYAVKEELPLKCRPCEGGVSPLPKEKVEILLVEHRNWQLIEDKRISREFKFRDFTEARYFLDLVSVIAEEQGHHPTLTLTYNKLKITLATYSAGGLTENDFIMAKIIDEIGV
jgi:thiol peroxidase